MKAYSEIAEYTIDSLVDEYKNGRMAGTLEHELNIFKSRLVDEIEKEGYSFLDRPVFDIRNIFDSIITKKMVDRIRAACDVKVDTRYIDSDNAVIVASNQYSSFEIVLSHDALRRFVIDANMFLQSPTHPVFRKA